MFARAMGAKDEANASILEKAHQTYDELLLNYSLSWGQDELAYLLYKGVFDTSDLDTYIKDVKNDPMKRYEAAIIITKALGGEEEAMKNSAVTLDYTDAKTIPTNALSYVAYASDKEIMNGMDDGSFAPHASVSRAQMAVMLSRVVGKTGYEYMEAKLISIDTKAQTLVLKDSDGNENEYVYTDDTQFMIMGTPVKHTKMIDNVAVTVALDEDTVVSIDSLYGESDMTVTGKYQGSVTSSGRVMIKLIPHGSTKIQTYYCAENVMVTYGGKPATMRSFKEGDAMSISISGGEIYEVTGEEQEYEIAGAIVESVDIEDDLLTMTISHSSSEYDGQVLVVAANATVKKNGTKTNFSEIYPGDSVNVTMQYGEAIKVTATSVKKTVEGVVQSVINAEQSSMVVRINGEDETYILANDVPITKDGADVTLYDIRHGDNVKITLDSQAIVKIECLGSKVYEEGKVTGKITAINTSLGFVKITTESANNETVFCNDTKTKIVNILGATLNMRNLEEGNKITAYGSVSSGAFVATLIVVES